jgi:hypothetical protein
LVFNHEWFEDFLDFTAVGQEALVDIFCDAIAVILDLLDDLEGAETDEQAAAIDAEITTNRLAAQTLDRSFTDYGDAITA